MNSYLSFSQILFTDIKSRTCSCSSTYLDLYAIVFSVYYAFLYDYVYEMSIRFILGPLDY